MSLSGIAITRVVDGQVVSDWGEFDIMGLLVPLGVVQPPSGGPGAAAASGEPGP